MVLGHLTDRAEPPRPLIIPFLLFVFAGMTSCASVPSRDFQEQVGPPIPFQELLEKGEAYNGKKVILGGYLLETMNEEQASLITILQAPLDSRNKPKAQDLSEGRFLVQTHDFLDPEIYSKGRRLTVGGTMSAVQERPLGNRSYLYPVIEAEELYLWPKERDLRPYHPCRDYWHYPWDRGWHPHGPHPWWGW